jgi:signal transduction histidine kinase
MTITPADGFVGCVRGLPQTENAMAPKHTTSQRSRFSFRRLVVISVAAQLVMISTILAVAAFSALETVDASNQLRDSSNARLLMRNLQDEFNESRLALQDYVAAGDHELAPYSQAQNQVALMSGALEPGVDRPMRVRFNRYVNSLAAYNDKVGDPALLLAKQGRKARARELVDGPQSIVRVKSIEREGDALQHAFDRLQAHAEHAVRDRQYLSVGLIALAGLLMLGTGMGVLLWIRRETMQPLDKLATASRKLGHGDLSVRVAPRGVEEIVLASTAFNQMADEIEGQMRQLHEAATARSNFVSSVSHELRTPITSLRGYLELLAAGEAGELAPDQLHYVNIAARNARSLDELINDLLTLSRIQSGRITINPEPVDIRALLRELKAEMFPIAAEKKVDLVLVDTGELIVSGDSLRLKQAFGNLIGNAIKYSPAGQAVVVRAFRIERQVVVSVVDWGMGIPKDDLPQLAEPFFRSSASKQIPGTGLGLPIAKQMVELHGGRLAVESEAGAGSTFTVYLPLRSESGEPDVAPDADADSSAEPTAPTTRL